MNYLGVAEASRGSKVSSMSTIRLKEPVSGLTHLAGALLGPIAVIFLILTAWPRASAVEIAAFTVFGLSLFLLYSASAIYHLAYVSPKAEKRLKILDHAMIFVLIAGTYTPFCLIPLAGTTGYVMLAVVWGLALVGLPMKIFWHNAPRFLSTAIYVLMGWVVILAIVPLWRATTPFAFWWLVAGGASYTVGAVVYAIKWPDPLPPVFGFHEVWHIFVLGGSVSHFISVCGIAR